MKKADSQVAPGTLEVVRTFLNTWRIPNDTRETADELVSLPAMQHFYSTCFLNPGGDAGVQGCRLCAEVVALVVEAIAHNTWMRLKACPDCHWVFYDHTRNRNKVWCLMVAGGPQGRSCGSISKVRSFRERQKARRPLI